MIQDIKVIKFMITEEGTTEKLLVQTRFPKTKKKRIMKKWKDKNNKIVLFPVCGLIFLGMDWTNKIAYGKVHPEYYTTTFKRTAEKYNSDPSLPNMELVER